MPSHPVPVRLLSLSALLLSLSALALPARAANVVELFTSHGCSSCPPADAVLEQLIKEDPDLVALEFHVDYWNDLVHGADGSWVDPFSKREYTDRQRLYEARRLKGRTGVYTPQVVVNGYYATIGSHGNSIRTALARAKATESSIEFEAPADTTVGLQASVSNVSDEVADLVAVEFDKKRTTLITAGENRDLEITNHNIVRSMKTVASLAPGTSQVFKGNQLTLNKPTDDTGCALLLQLRGSGQILAAENCR